MFEGVDKKVHHCLFGAFGRHNIARVDFFVQGFSERRQVIDGR